MSIKIINKEKLEEGIKRIAEQDIENESFGVGYSVIQNSKKVYEGYFGNKGPDRYGELNGKTMYLIKKHGYIGDISVFFYTKFYC